MKTARLLSTALLALGLLSGVRAADAPVAAAVPGLPIAAKLEAVQGSLYEAIGIFHAAGTSFFSPDNARLAMERAVADVIAARQYALANPAIATLPATVPLTALQARIRLTYSSQTDQPVFSALAPLKTALDALEATPGGELGGFREKITVSINGAASTIVNGMQNAASRNRAAGGGGALSPAAAAAPVAETARQRLLILQGRLRAVRDALNHLPAGAEGDFVEQALAAVKDALADAAGALRYVADHPEADALPGDTVTVFVPGFTAIRGDISNALYNLRPNVVAGFVADAYPTLPVAMEALAAALPDFLNGTPPPGVRPAGAVPANAAGGPVIGVLGGFRDRLLRQVGLALHALAAGAAALPTLDAGPAAPPLRLNAAATGAISGLVLDAAREPVANALITLSPVHRTGYQGYRAALPMTLTDASGAFSIPEVPPGAYLVSAGLDGVRVSWSLNRTTGSVEVKASTETKLATPINLR